MDKKSYIVPAEVFQSLPNDQKLDTMFFYISALHDNIEVLQERTNGELRKLKNQRWVNKSIAAGAGGVGSLIFRIGEFILSKL